MRSTTSMPWKCVSGWAASPHCATTAASAATQPATPSQARPPRRAPLTKVSASRITQPMAMRISIGA